MAEPNPELSSDLTTQTKKKNIVPKFTEIFPVENMAYPYSAFITSARKEVMKYCTDRTGIIQPVLPPEKKVPELWFYAELKTMASSITLAIRMDNLYLVGFRTPGKAGVWWEFNNETGSHLLDDGARWLGFGGRYQDLIGNKGLETVTMGRDEMARAVNSLADHGTKEMPPMEEELQLADRQADAKSKLVKLVIMVCEGLRFFTVSRKVDEGFNNPLGVTITEMQGKQVQKWDRISKAAFEWATNPNAVIPDMQKLGIRDKNEAAKIVALVKNQTSTAATASENDDEV